jgi:hypothetical protein
MKKEWVPEEVWDKYEYKLVMDSKKTILRIFLEFSRNGMFQGNV